MAKIPRARPNKVQPDNTPAVDPGSPYDESLGPPSWLNIALEARAPWELAASVALVPWLRRLPSGDGHSVIVIPGLGVSDFSTLPLRSFLRDRGYDPHPWRQGFNFGPKEGVLAGCLEQLKALHRQSGGPVSLIGWSLGGIYARELAKEQPDLVRCVITLGSPFAGHPRATNAWRLFELVSGQSAHDHALIDAIKTTPPVPTTSIYSRTDGIVAWQCSINPDTPMAENIEIQASHIGLGMHPLAMMAVADRLAQRREAWQPFEVEGLRRWFFKRTVQAEATGAA
jgi:pimeloyl-ACP methyl ester carboxylesterase